jgi:hypothetical protein
MRQAGWFALGTVAALLYGALAVAIGSALGSDAAGLCLLVSLLGWGALAFVAYRRDWRWFALGWFAAPAVLLLLLTASCFVLLGLESAASAAPLG